MKSHQKQGQMPSYDPPSYDSGSNSLGKFDDDLDLDKESADGGWGAGGKDDFGFGSAMPPPQASEPVPVTDAVEEEEGGGDVPAIDASVENATEGEVSAPSVDGVAA